LIGGCPDEWTFAVAKYLSQIQFRSATKKGDCSAFPARGVPKALATSDQLALERKVKEAAPRLRNGCEFVADRRVLRTGIDSDLVSGRHEWLNHESMRRNPLMLPVERRGFV
jgi:hypothetical protein